VDDLVRIAVDWVCDNRAFIGRLVGTGSEGWDAGEVVSRLAWRALRGGGIVRSLQAHVEGGRQIRSPEGILRYHVSQVVRECVREAGQRRRYEAPVADVPEQACDPQWCVEDGEVSADGYQQVIDALTDQTLLHLTGGQSPPPIVEHVRGRIPHIWKIFCQAAPPRVARQLSLWPEGDRDIVLLAIFPLRLPHRAVATYLRLTRPGQPDVSEAAVQRQVSRLRDRLARQWPMPVAPAPATGAGSVSGQGQEDDSDE
jgi:hypothetical protein